MNLKKRILVAPLNWGIGHATRCIPIINNLIVQGFEPVIASDGEALVLLKKEFSKLEFIELPSYNMRYPKKGSHFKLKLLFDLPKLLNTVKAEEKAIKKIVKVYNISGIISDNRPGIYCKDIPSVYISHQLHVLSGTTTWLSTKMHQKFINRFDCCWVPDTNSESGLSGKLGHNNSLNIPVRYIGTLSRLQLKKLPLKFDILVLISGPEPQRTLFQDILFHELKTYTGRVVFVKGIIEEEQRIEEIGNMLVNNFMTSDILEKAINESKLIISRSGYSTVMDLATLNKKAFFIPTPGQFEQEYLAERLMKLNYAPYCTQGEFTLDKLNSVKNYKGLSNEDFQVDFKELFSLFKGE